MTCSEFDGDTLKREARDKNINVPCYYKRWINLKKVFPSQMDFMLEEKKEESKEEAKATVQEEIKENVS